MSKRARTFALYFKRKRMNEIVINEEVRRLMEKLDDLKRISARLYNKREEMLTFEAPKLSALYTSLIGSRKMDEFILTVEVRSLKMQVELMQAFINRNDEIDEEYVQKKIEEEYEYLQKLIKEREAQILAAKEFFDAPSLTPEETSELRASFRMIVRKLHPDINSNITNEQKDLYIKAVAAYKSCDLVTIRQIVLMIDTGDVKYLPRQDLNDEIAKLEKLIEGYKTRLDELEKQFPFSMRENLYDKEWVAKEQATIEEQIQSLKKQKTELEQYIQMLKLWKPDSLS